MLAGIEEVRDEEKIATRIRYFEDNSVKIWAVPDGIEVRLNKDLATIFIDKLETLIYELREYITEEYEEEEEESEKLM
jgi:hypothetical protein